MKFITTQIHGFIDYAVGILFIALPWVLDINCAEPQGLVMIVSGFLILIYSVLTDYELGVLRVLPMPLHLAFDMISGMLLAFSPWILAFSEKIYLPHLFLGLFEILIAILTKTKTGDRTQWLDSDL